MKSFIKFLQTYKLEITVFLCGAIVMVFELVGSRVLAPYLGTSIYVWTSLIGVILGSLSLGYYFGGKLADKNQSYAVFSFCIMTAAIFLLLMNLIRESFLIALPLHYLRIELATLLAALILFAPASFLLGMVSPYAIKLKLSDLKKTASTAGNLMAWSTIGSIVGTLGAGFLIIPFLGTNLTLNLLAIFLTVTAIYVNRQNLKWYKFSLLATLIIATGFQSYTDKNDFYKFGFLDIDTQYNRIQLKQQIDVKTEQPVFTITTDPFGAQSAMYLNSDDLVFNYTKFYNLAAHFKPSFKKTLMLGGCAYSYPKELLNKYPEATIDVVEIDPGFTEIARQYFRLPDTPRLTIYHEDARTFLNNTENYYEVIFGDAFNSTASVPFQLTTLEAIKRQSEILEDDGIVIINIISSLTGEQSKFLQAEYATFKKVFPQVYLFKVTDEPADEIQNFILVALKNNVKPSFTNEQASLNELLSKRVTEELQTDLPILTDDYVPVDFYQRKNL